jgi:hypothetical protein
MKLDYQKLRELVQQTVEGCGGGMVHPTAAPSPITIIPNEKPDPEGKIAKQQIFGVINDASQLEALLLDDDQLPAWVQSKLTKASDYISAVKKYLEYELARGPSAMMPQVSVLPLHEQDETLLSDDWKALAGLLERAVSGAQGSGEKAAYSEALDFVQHVVKYLQENTLVAAEAIGSLAPDPHTVDPDRPPPPLKGASQDILELSVQLGSALGLDGDTAQAVVKWFSEKGLLAQLQESILEASEESEEPDSDANDKAKEASGDKKQDVQRAAKLMFKHPKLPDALGRLKGDKIETAQLIAVIAGQLGLDAADLSMIAMKAKGEM